MRWMTRISIQLRDIRRRSLTIVPSILRSRQFRSIHDRRSIAMCLTRHSNRTDTRHAVHRILLLSIRCRECRCGCLVVHLLWGLNIVLLLLLRGLYVLRLRGDAHLRGGSELVVHCDGLVVNGARIGWWWCGWVSCDTVTVQMDT